ncbi:hypothetical protein F5B18DRAFT_608912 [Nemania serpens]|nr:hypothetical protein F5B18DRAFT_608912 [Nemania serpens]
MKLTGGLQSTLRTTIAAITDGLKTNHPTKLFSQPIRNLTYSTNTTRRYRAILQPSQPLPTHIKSKHRPYSSSSSAKNSSSNPSSSPPSPTMAAPETNPENSSSNNNSTTQPETSSHTAPLPALPAAAADADGPSQTLEVGGAALRLDHLGPLVVNADGTLSRIANWEKMAEIERENTLRILGKRNQMRLAKLRAAKSETDGSADGAARGTEER